MKKFTVLLALIACASFIFAQSAINDSQLMRKAEGDHIAPVFKSKPVAKPSNEAKSTPAWSENFEEEGVRWDIQNQSPTGGTLHSDIIWEIGNLDNFNAANAGSLGTLGTYLTNVFFRDSGESVANFFKGGKAAYINLLSETPAKKTDSYIQFTANCDTVERTPKLTFYQQILNLNREQQWFEWIIGTDWETAETNGQIKKVRLYQELQSNTFGDTIYEILLPGAEEQAQVSFRFRWDQSTDYSNNGVHAYFWLIDNLSINSAPIYDIVLNDFRVNSLRFLNYHEETNINASGENLLYHYYGLVGQIPLSQARNGNAAIGFSASTKNVGHSDANVNVKVTITKDGASESIYSYTMPFINPNLSNELGDTLDAWGAEAWTIPADIETGKYIVDFEAIIDNAGAVDANPNNNLGQAFFFITDNVYSGDAQAEIADLSIDSPNSYTIGAAMEKGTGFDFTYHLVDDEYISSIEFYLGARSTPGSYLNIVAMYANASMEEYETVTSTRYDVKTEDKGTWVKVPFQDLVEITTEYEQVTNSTWAQMQLQFNFTYPTDNDTLTIGFDGRQKISKYTTLLKSATLYSLYDAGNPAIRLNVFNMSSITPENGATDVDREAEIVLEFTDSVPLRLTHLTNVKIEKVSDNSNSLVENVAIVADATNPNKFRITHDKLAGNTEYRVTIEEDVIRNYKSISWTFKTLDVSVSNGILNNMEIYPNPTSGVLNVNNVKGGTIEVLNIMGQVIEKIDVANELNTINISNYSNGNYFVRVIVDGEVAIEKINLTK